MAVGKVKFLLRVKDSAGAVDMMECDWFSYNVDTRDLLLYDDIDQDNKKLIGAFNSVVYWRVVKPDPEEK